MHGANNPAINMCSHLECVAVGTCGEDELPSDGRTRAWACFESIMVYSSACHRGLAVTLVDVGHTRRTYYVWELRFS